MKGFLTVVMTTLALMVICPVCASQAPAEKVEAGQAAQGSEVKNGELKPELVRRWKSMTTEERERMRGRLRRWRAMTPEERQRVLLNMERFRKLTPEQRERLIETRKRWGPVSPEVRQRVRQQFERFRQLPPEARQKMMQRIVIAKEFLKSDFEALKQAPKEQHEALHRDIHRKLRALAELKGEQLESFRRMGPDEQAAKLKELIDKLPPEQRSGHDMHGPNQRAGENAKPEQVSPEPVPAPTH